MKEKEKILFSKNSQTERKGMCTGLTAPANMEIQGHLRKSKEFLRIFIKYSTKAHKNPYI